MLENFIYAKQKSLFEEALNNGEVLDEAIVFIEDTKEIWNHGTYFDGNAINLKTINGKSILGEGDLITDIVVNSVEELNSLDVPIGTKARIFNEIPETVYEGLNLGRIFLGTETNPLPPDFNETPNKYTFNIEVDTNVSFPYDESVEHIRVALPTQSPIYVYIDQNFNSISSIDIQSGCIEMLYRPYSSGPNWMNATYLHSLSFKELVSQEQINTLLAISSAFNGSITAPAQIIIDDYVKTSKGWLPSQYSIFDQIYYSIPTKTSQLENDSNFVSFYGLKTINGESIVGSGNIVIESGSSAYAEVSHGTSDTTFTLTPNTFHVWNEVASLDLSFGSETSGVANEYLFQFTSGATATTLTLPDDIKWANDITPSISENMIYQISVLKGLGSVLEFSNSVEKVANYIDGQDGGNTITAQYPVASDITIEYWDEIGDDIHTVVMSAGTSEVSTSERFGYIENISPKEDDQYFYLHY